MKVVLAVTDAGKAFVKPLGGSDHGPHSLACEWVGTCLATWFGLPTLDHALMVLTDLDAEMIRDAGGQAQPGHAFVTRAVEQAHPWGGSGDELKHVGNTDAIPGMVVFDTWSLNWDRCPPKGDARKLNYDNVLLARDDADRGRLRMLAIDHGECFAVGQELGRQVASIDRMRDERIFGLFSVFEPYVKQPLVEQAAARLPHATRAVADEIVGEIPNEWQVDKAARTSLVELVSERAAYLADNITVMLRDRIGKLFY